MRKQPLNRHGRLGGDLRSVTRRDNRAALPGNSWEWHARRRRKSDMNRVIRHADSPSVDMQVQRHPRFAYPTNRAGSPCECHIVSSDGRVMPSFFRRLRSVLG